MPSHRDPRDPQRAAGVLAARPVLRQKANPMMKAIQVRAGDHIRLGGVDLLVIRVGRGLSRSAVVLERGVNEPKLLTEIDYHWPRLGMEVISSKPVNKKFVKEYLDAHPATVMV